MLILLQDKKVCLQNLSYVAGYEGFVLKSLGENIDPTHEQNFLGVMACVILDIRVQRRRRKTCSEVVLDKCSEKAFKY